MSEAMPRPHRRLGDILEECRVVTHAQVEAALNEQRRTGKLFGEALIDMGFVTEDDLGWALSTQLDIPYIDLTADMVDRNTLALIEPELLRRYKVLPLVRVGDALTVAVADPTNREAIRAIEQATRLSVQVSIASPRRLSRILHEVCGAEAAGLDSSSDLLFREITRPSVSIADSLTPRPNPLGMLVSQALRERVREIHLDPGDGAVRVRFRRGTRLDEQPTIDLDDYRAMVSRLHRTFGEGLAPGEPLAVGSTVAFSEARLRVVLTLFPGPGGDILVLELEETRAADADLDRLFGDPGTAARLRHWLNDGEGLLMVTGPGAALSVVSLALLSACDRSRRRVGAVGPELAGLLGDVIEMGASRRRDEGAHLFDPVEARFVDVLFAGESAPGAEFDHLLRNAHAGRVIVTRQTAPDAATALALAAEATRTRSLLARSIFGVVETGLDAGGRARASLLAIGPETARALDVGAGAGPLAAAARADGWQPLAGPDADRTPDQVAA